MGKKTNTDKLNLKPVALGDQLAPGESVKNPRLKKRKRDEEEGLVTQKEMNKFLKLARDQLADDSSKMETDQDLKSTNEKPTFTRAPPSEAKHDSDAESTGYEDYDDQTIDEETRRELEEFAKMLKDDNFADLFVDTVSTRQSEVCSQMSDHRDTKVDAKTASVYKKLGILLKSHRSGPLPKPFKLIPNHINREELIELMEPDNWSAAAVHEATCILVSNLKANDAARFMENVLLPRVRDDLRQFNKLNFHLYKSLFKCLFKCFSFIKGILLPLCRAGDCNVNEATKISSIIANGSLKEVSIGLAICEICAMPYSPANMIFLETLIEKRCALPIHAINSTIVFLLGFKKEMTKPQRWFSCLKSLVKHYKEYIPAEARSAFLKLLEGDRFQTMASFIRQELKEAQ